MTKSPKTDRLREMREAKHTKALTPGKRIIKALKEALEIAQGKREPARVTTVMVPASAAKVLGSTGGKSKSPAKQAASRNNGKKGGRPKNPS